MARRSRQIRRCLAVGRPSRWVGAGREQELGERLVAVLTGGVQRAVVVLVGCVDVGTGGDEETGNVEVTAGRGAVKRHDTERIASNAVRVGVMVQE